MTRPLHEAPSHVHAQVAVIGSSGGFITPAHPYLTVEEASQKFRLFAEAMPTFFAVRGGIDYRPPEVRWAIEREREMRALTKMWDFPGRVAETNREVNLMLLERSR